MKLFWSVLSFVWCKNRKLECERVVVRGTKTSNYHLPYSRHNASYQQLHISLKEANMFINYNSTDFKYKYDATLQMLFIILKLPGYVSY